MFHFSVMKMCSFILLCLVSSIVAWHEGEWGQRQDPGVAASAEKEKTDNILKKLNTESTLTDWIKKKKN